MVRPVGRAEASIRRAPDIWKITSGQSFGGVVTLGSGQAAVDIACPALSSLDLIFHNQGLTGSLSAIASNTGVLVVTSATYNVGSGVITIGKNTAVADKWDTIIHWYTVRRGV